MCEDSSIHPHCNRIKRWGRGDKTEVQFSVVNFDGRVLIFLAAAILVVNVLEIYSNTDVIVFPLLKNSLGVLEVEL